jgi:hypothetical protein
MLLSQLLPVRCLVLVCSSISNPFHHRKPIWVVYGCSHYWYQHVQLLILMSMLLPGRVEVLADPALGIAMAANFISD